MEQEKYIIIKWPEKRYGYKKSFSLMRWNSVYEKYIELKFALDIQFIYDYCLLNNIDNSKNFSIIEK